MTDEEPLPPLSRLRRWAPSLGAFTVLALLASMGSWGGNRARGGGGRLSEGGTAPPLRLKLSDGSDFDLEEASREQVVVVNFWAAWCPPCRKEGPELQRVAEWMASERLGLLVGVAVDGASLRQVVSQARSFGMRYPMALPPPRAYRAWGIEGLPTTVVVAPGGTIHRIHYGPIDAATLRKAVREASGRR